MPRTKKGGFMHGEWDYTLLADDFENLDSEAANLNPPAGTMHWHGYGFPDVAYKVTPTVNTDGSSGTWWIPSNFWRQGDLVLNILVKSVMLGAVPVIKDELLVDNKHVEIMRSEVVYIPRIPNNSNEYSDDTDKLRALMKNLSTGNKNECDKMFSELVSVLKKYRGKFNEETKVKLCLLRFPCRKWIDGPAHQRIHPAIVIQTDLIKRYHSPMD